MKVISTLLSVLIAGQIGITFAQVNQAPTATPKPDERRIGSIPIFSQIVVFQHPKNWKLAHRDESATTFMMEFIPNDQEIGNWSEMITVQGFKNLAKAPNASPDRFLEMLAAGMKKSCGDNFVGKSLFTQLKIDSFDSSGAALGCANLTSDLPSGMQMKGKGELGMYIAIKGSNDFYLVHRAIRSAAFDPKALPISDKTFLEWFSAVMPIKICDRVPNVPDTAPQTECWNRAPRQ